MSRDIASGTLTSLKADAERRLGQLRQEVAKLEEYCTKIDSVIEVVNQFPELSGALAVELPSQKRHGGRRIRKNDDQVDKEIVDLIKSSGRGLTAFQISKQVHVGWARTMGRLQTMQSQNRLKRIDHQWYLVRVRET